MNRRDLAARLLATFLNELEEQVAIMDSELLGLEAAPGDSARLSALFRIAHTLKGAARAVDIRAVERICHALEGLIQRMTDGTIQVGPGELALLYATADTLRETGTRVRAGTSIDDSRIEALVEALKSGAAERLPPTAGGPPPGSDRVDAPRESATADHADAFRATVQPQRQVRVDAGRLDELVAATTRLEAARSGVVLRHSDLEIVHGLIAHAVKRCLGLSRRLRRVDMVGESAPLVHDLDTVENELRDLADLIDRVTESSRRSTRAIAQAAHDVGDSTRGLRMRPLSEACEGLPRAVRDLAAAAQKDVRFELRGGDVEADRDVLDGLREALLQLVRNAVDHGIEPPAVRERAGKPRTGTVSIAAALVGDRLTVTVSDDGAGLNLPELRAALERRGRALPESDEEIAHAIFEGGMSTRSDVTDLSGRGVGLDIVHHAVQQIRGSVSVQWQPAGGTSFTITCPPTFAIFRAVVASVGGHLLAIPAASIRTMLRVQSSDVRVAEGRQMLTGNEEPVRLVSLSQLMPPLQEQPRDPRPVIVLTHGDQRLAIAVDELVSEEEIVLRPLDGLIGPVPHLSGAALLGPGRVALVLNPASLITAASHSAADSAHGTTWSVERQQMRTVLVVDDSITTRTLEQSILAAAGYRVLTAVDGAEGWNVLRDQGADLVVADVEMPRMDGFTLCDAIRGSKRFAQLPVVLVTALDSAEHRARGLEVGADAYIIKSGFDQQSLLDTVHQLLG